MKKEIRKCAKCGKKFTAKAANQKYCSAKCKSAVKHELERQRKAAKKAAKPTTKKPVKCADKVTLPKKCVKHSIKVEKVSNSRMVLIGLGIAVKAFEAILKGEK